jgi:predicted ATP-grasp superfamily ATP-dependent carboligase
MQPLIWDRRPDGLRAPAMVCAFEGWNDAGEAASGAVSFLASALEARRFAHLDSEEFYDFQSNRPTVAFGEGEGRELTWPTVEIFEAPAPRAPRDLVLVRGVEPSFRWRSFGGHIVDLARTVGVELVVTLGALLAEVPHTRPVRVTGTAQDHDLSTRLGLHPSRYEGPTGIVGVLHHACSQAGLPSVTLWGAVPHYVAAASNPKTALALLRKVEVLVGVSVDVSELEAAAADYERQVALAVQSDPDIQAFVERLERVAESEEEQGLPEQMPSGDALAREFQRFLRQRGPQ